MNKITKLPRFMPGQVIDISYRHKGLPNRLLIKSAFVREQDTEWMYSVYLENVGENTILPQKFILENMVVRDTNVYKCADVIKAYNDGWRFCGNYCKNTAQDTAAKYSTNKYIKNIILKPALNSNGCLIHNKYGIWIRYNNPISDDGIITSDADTDVIVIK